MLWIYFAFFKKNKVNLRKNLKFNGKDTSFLIKIYFLTNKFSNIFLPKPILSDNVKPRSAQSDWILRNGACRRMHRGASLLAVVRRGLAVSVLWTVVASAGLAAGRLFGIADEFFGIVGSGVSGLAVALGRAGAAVAFAAAGR